MLGAAPKSYTSIMTTSGTAIEQSPSHAYSSLWAFLCMHVPYSAAVGKGCKVHFETERARARSKLSRLHRAQSRESINRPGAQASRSSIGVVFQFGAISTTTAWTHPEHAIAFRSCSAPQFYSGMCAHRAHLTLSGRSSARVRKRSQEVQLRNSSIEPVLAFTATSSGESRR
ncbi:hypothetical protein IE81DRAFT_66404 [Ceraceosorus guamensis]|uniref:Uncharacterized protein n=1 Tax=Ceraceosorus guamensis TaxID=1522189 RepID=A0A316W4X2_9BASI|nr:hypothetical protein IE81DRAFT_66404 [Ceraceosorus guamensis]PWN43711.1 hypothetical protein IE81DRAFT_66404 [Ceraceosorus guamensis]